VIILTIRKSSKKVLCDAGTELRKKSTPKDEKEFAAGILAVKPRRKSGKK
jgi:hypothetical protein